MKVSEITLILNIPNDPCDPELEEIHCDIRYYNLEPVRVVVGQWPCGSCWDPRIPVEKVCVDGILLACYGELMFFQVAFQ